VGVARFDGRLSAPSHTKAVEPGSTELTWAVGLTLEIPLSKNEAEAARERADLALRKAKLTVERSKQIVVQEVRMAWRNVRSAWETLELTRSAVELAELKFQNERKLFRAGKSTARILTMVQAELLQERAKLQDAVAAFNKALVALRSASGTLVAEVDARV
jgi:outer membrane protein TolC